MEAVCRHAFTWHQEGLLPYSVTARLYDFGCVSRRLVSCFFIILSHGFELEILSHLWDICPPEPDTSPLTIAPSRW